MLRAALLLPLALVLVACGGGPEHAERGRCRAVTHGYRLCGQPAGSGQSGARSTIVRDGEVIAGPVERTGYWRKLFLSPDGKTLLAEWSGECELPTAFFVPAAGGLPRTVTVGSTSSRSSEALGWDGPRARVLLPRGAAGSGRSGVYLVDPRSLHATLVQPRPAKTGC
jgi:hypothetical protein